MSDASTREWRFYIDDMIGFAEKFRVQEALVGSRASCPPF